MVEAKCYGCLTYFYPDDVHGLLCKVKEYKIHKCLSTFDNHHVWPIFIYFKYPASKPYTSTSLSCKKFPNTGLNPPKSSFHSMLCPSFHSMGLHTHTYQLIQDIILSPCHYISPLLWVHTFMERPTPHTFPFHFLFLSLPIESYVFLQYACIWKSI